MASYDFKTKDQLLAVGTIVGTDITAIKQGSAEDVRITMAQLASYILNQSTDNTKTAARAATAAALPTNTYAAGVITATANGALPVQDGVTLIVGNRLLVKNEGGVSPVIAPPAHIKNGVYTVTQLGVAAVSPFILTRATDMDVWAEFVSALVPVAEGTTQSDSYWYFPADSSGTLGTTAVAVQKFVGSNVYQPYDPKLTAYVTNLGTESYKTIVRAATTVALPANTYAAGVITATANGALPNQDGVTLVVGNRLFVKNEGGTTPAIAPPAHINNGIYTVTQVGTGSLPFILTRSTDMDTWIKFISALVPISEGSTQADSYWYIPADSGGVVGTNTVTVQKFIGPDVYQAYDAKLTALVTPAWAANTFPTFSGTSTMVIKPITTYGLSVLAQTAASPTWGNFIALPLAFL